ncbi:MULTISPECIES: hypothetical protein [Acidiplasma]|jgi:isocitrate dehydrogenase|uniref:Uncharacterized protein n=2 Tax=Acidiplasma TaxID=507753 RepID=A0A0Q0VUC7_9ARCH|nr:MULTISPECIES: hypothetical protein [Acidiplasma]KJE49359.1 hypothetical protein TZ01_04715 [Acidiplasma sp. MBA-1]KPV47641.1 hypothetical protein SE19_00195 [Acidiplasma aeolicum]KQB34492.1 hypothetical protein AOG54_04720 [Acidiplasma aeolicum]KQB35224.1 hypothetical protein AOG55_07395 [Acidiplasma cupricumulans]WMT54699.1 MAG: hypothetical protein RE470_07220 [Acidiplasma sp.]
MPWIPKKAVEKTVYSSLLKMDNGRLISLKTKKKDRSVTIYKDNNLYKIIEDGFKNESYEIGDEKELKKMLKTLIEIEFPRSHEILVTSQEDKN